MKCILQSVVLALCAVVQLAFSSTGFAQGTQSVLRPTDTASPRDTLFSFIEKIDRTYAAAQVGDTALSTEFLDQAVRYLDMSAYPPRIQRYQREELALLMKEVLDRIDLPSRESVPGVADATGQSRETGILLGGERAADVTPIELWQIPKTNIRIYRVAEGSRAGEYLFAPDTVAQLGDWYSRIKDLPYREGATPNIYFAFALTPGRGINLERSETMPDWMTAVGFGGQTLWQGIALVLTLLLVTIGTRVVLRAGRRFDAKRAADLPDDKRYNWRFGLLAALLIVTPVLFITERFVDDFINITGVPMAFLGAALVLLGYVALAVLSFLAIGQVFELIVLGREFGPRSAKAQLLRLVGYFVGTFAVVIVILRAADDFGVPAVTMLAGFGVGGIAVSLAARETLMDLFGSFVIMIEGPYRLNDFVTIGSHSGTVVEIGVRSTKLRTADNLIISIPHSFISSNSVSNYGYRGARLINSVLRIHPDTPTDKITEFLELVRASLHDNPMVRNEGCLVNLQMPGAGYLEVLLYFYVQVAAWADFVGAREQIMLKILECAKQAGVEMAPTQTIEASAVATSEGPVAAIKPG
ncbi:MAG: mechanosensitive ion channel family protein [Dinoroseobacter sp.]|nr:mechanosensitive ion channel family protein [Dinoroseobacter sp.]